MESWTLYDAMNGQEPIAITKFLEKHRPNRYSRDLAYPNPSYVDCTKAGGEYQYYYKTSEGVSYPLCRFEDGSAIEVWTFSAGPHAQQNQELIHLLK